MADGRVLALGLSNSKFGADEACDVALQCQCQCQCQCREAEVDGFIFIFAREG